MLRNLRADLTALGARQRALLVVVLLTGTTTFMLMPLLAVYLRGGGLGISLAGLCIGVLLVCQQGLGHVTGYLVDRLGAARILRVGLGLRLIGFVALAAAPPNPIGSLLTCAVIGVGGSLVTLPIRVEFAGVDAELRQRGLALRGAAVNISAIIGPAIGAVLVGVDFRLVAVAAVTSHLVALLSLSHRRFKAPGASEHQRERPTSFWGVLRDPHVRPVLLTAFAFWAGYSQLSTTVPIQVFDSPAGSAGLVAALFVINAVLVLALEYPLVRVLSARWGSPRMLWWSVAGLGAAFLTLATGRAVVVFIAFIVLLSLAEILYGSSIDDTTARLAPSGQEGLYLGTIGLGSSAGSLVGAAGGGAALDLARFLGVGPVYWSALALGAVGVLLALRPLTARLRSKPAEPGRNALRERPLVVLLEPRPTVIRATDTLPVDVLAIYDDATTPDPGCQMSIVDWMGQEGLVRLVDAVRPLAPDLILGFGEWSVAAAAQVADRIGCAGPQLAAVELTTDKAAFRDALERRGAPTVRRAIVHDVTQLPAAVREVGLPAILKPREGTASRAVHLLTEHRYDDIEFDPRYGDFVVEEFLVGPECSVESISRDGVHEVVAVTEKTTTCAPNFVETRHIVPAGLPAGTVEALADATGAVLDAVGLRTGLAHTEFILTAAGPVPVESHARPGGDRITDLVRLATGRDLFVEVVAAHLGLPVPIGHPAYGQAAIEFLTAPSDGTFVAATGIDTLLAHDWVAEVQVDLRPGEPVPAVVDSETRAGFVVVHAGSRSELLDRLDRAVSGIELTVADPSSTLAPS